MSPCLDNRPYVGFNPTRPQNDAGLRVEPPVSEPNALHTLNTKLYATLVQKASQISAKRKTTQSCNNVHNSNYDDIKQQNGLYITKQVTEN